MEKKKSCGHFWKHKKFILNISSYIQCAITACGKTVITRLDLNESKEFSKRWENQHQCLFSFKRAFFTNYRYLNMMVWLESTDLVSLKESRDFFQAAPSPSVIFFKSGFKYIYVLEFLSSSDLSCVHTLHS